MITLQDMIDRFGRDELAELTDPDRHEVINEAVVNIAVSAAVAYAGGYLNSVGLVRRNSVGSFIYIEAVVPDDLVDHICNVARYKLHKDGVSENIKDRYDDATSWLKDVKKDPTMLTGVITPPASTASSVFVIPNPVPTLYGD